MATEIEIKRLLDAHGYERLRRHLDSLGAPERQEQVNHYLDLPDAALRQAGAMLRLRVIGERLVLTLKARANVSHGVLQAQELERELTTAAERTFWLQRPVPWQAAVMRLDDWLTATGLALSAARDSALIEVGSTANLRLVYRLAAGIPGWPLPLTLELDHTRYPGGIDRLELECEHVHAHELAPLLDAWLTRLDVVGAHATETKYAQFLRLASMPPALRATWE